MVAVRGKRTGRVLLTVAVATFWALTSGAGAQTLQPKAVQPALAPQQREQAPSPQAQPAPPQWNVGCASTQAGLDCRAVQTLTYQQGDNRIQISAVVRIEANTKEPELVLLRPLGANLPKG